MQWYRYKISQAGLVSMHVLASMVRYTKFMAICSVNLSLHLKLTSITYFLSPSVSPVQ